MKCLIATLIIWMLSTACLTFAAADEAAAVKAVVQEFFAAYKAGDVDTLARYLLPDISIFFLDGGLRTKGMYLPSFKTLYDTGYRPNLQVKQIDATVYDTTAVATGYMDGTITLGRNVLEGPWRLSVVLRKHDGIWKIAHVHQSPMIPAPQQPVAVRFPDAIVGGLSQPPGSGPFPAVVLLPGCSSPLPYQQRWAKTLQEWGVRDAHCRQFWCTGDTANLYGLLPPQQCTAGY
jgi:ketosteroid isomerase-like protein